MATPISNARTDPNPTKLLIYSDHQHPCSYLPEQQARMPLLLPLKKLSPTEFDRVLEQGYRRSGKYIYFTACPNCQACEPTRLHLNQFRWTRSLRRVKKRGDEQLHTVVSVPTDDDKRLAIFNEHRIKRSLSPNEETYSNAEYQEFLVESCCDTMEFSFWMQEQLVGCAIVDIGHFAVSAVYTYFNPDYSQFSIGTYAILKAIEWAISHEKEILYLGMYVARNQHLNYKGRFLPQERLINCSWHYFAVE